MSSVNEINNTMTQISNSTNAANAARSKMGTSEMGQDAFLRLMLEQMKNQDPTKPTDNSQMMLQNATFTQVNELQKMNSANSMTQAYSLMGKKVTILDPNDKQGRSTLSGKIAEVRTNGSSTSVIFDGDTTRTAYPLKNIQSVAEGGTTTGITHGTLTGASAANQYSGLLNQYQINSTTGQVAKTTT
ncbi:MAG: flagellar hook capping FlgD N-terminal domain-containing protein [bacterium]